MTPPLLVTDTHPLIWYITNKQTKLPAKIIKAFDDAVAGQAAILVPLVVLWELSMAVKSGKVKLAVPLDQFVKEHFFAKAISLVPIETEDILRFHTLSITPDPFDSLIVATALRLDCPLISGDSIIHKQKPCRLYWF